MDEKYLRANEINNNDNHDQNVRLIEIVKHEKRQQRRKFHLCKYKLKKMYSNIDIMYKKGLILTFKLIFSLNCTKNARLMVL